MTKLAGQESVFGLNNNEIPHNTLTRKKLAFAQNYDLLIYNDTNLPIYFFICTTGKNRTLLFVLFS